jgi:hypothetical protein
MMAKVYTAWGIAALLLLGAAQYQGWSLTSSTQSKTNPKSVRSNPGAYRSSYYIPGRTMRGK